MKLLKGIGAIILFVLAVVFVAACFALVGYLLVPREMM